MAGGKFSDDGWSWSETDSQDALGLIVGKFSDDGWRWNEVDNLDALGLTESSKFSYGSWIAMKLIVLMLLA